MKCSRTNGWKNSNITLIKNRNNSITLFQEEQNKKKYSITGPLSPDTSFLQRNKLKIDVLIGHYHDQILTAFKTKFDLDAINITIGLPFVRISPDHGVGTDIIGKGIANPKSFKNAIKFFSKYNV